MVRIILACVLLLGVHPAAWADEAEPSVHIAKDGSIEGQITLPFPESEVYHLLSDPVASSKLNRDVYDASSKRQGACEIVYRKVRGVWSPMTYRAKRCPTTHGWVEQLIDSESVSDYYMEWELERLSSGTRVKYKVRTQINAPIPTSIIQSETKRSVTQMLKNLLKKITGQKKSKK